ncbi:MAG: leucine-rich repeat protein [Oscillospiraceae bacterium]|nr:leucine-rich repeat protein [Oscillospiraceae bacterium]
MHSSSASGSPILPNVLIGDSAFSRCNGLTSISIPGSVTLIDEYAFYNCENLEYVTFSEGLQSIGHLAFSECDKLKSIVIPNSVYEIHSDAFRNCDNLSSVKLGSGLQTIGTWAFAYCPNLVNLTFANTNTTLLICQRAFCGCTGLKTLDLPDNVDFDYDDQFMGCTGFTSVRIGNGATHIPASCFYSCTNLETASIGNNVTEIGMSAFENCEKLNCIFIPKSVNEICSDAFNNCTGLKDVYFGGSITDWAAIELGSYNDALASANIHFNCSGLPGDKPTISINVTVNGKTVQWTDAAPFINSDSRTMVPLRAVAEALGLNVSWNDSNKEASFSSNGKTITFPINSKTYRTESGATGTMDTAAVIVSSRTYAPIRYLAEYFGYNVGWNDANKTVIINGSLSAR